MKSKRKELNKFKNKQQIIDQEQDNQESIKRTTGVKPFHLSKLRMHKRHSEEFLNKKVNLNVIADKYVVNNQNSERREIQLDLIIKKKLLIDGQKNVKLQSQRKSLVYLDIDQNDQRQDTQSLIEDMITEETEFKNVNSQNLQAFKSQDFTNNLYTHKKGRRFPCCQQMQGYPTQAIIRKTNYFLDHQHSSQRSNSQHSQNVIDAKAQLQNILQKASKSPFSFTNVKWRSKSQLAVIDKWKQKYEKSNDILNSPLKKYKSVSKIMANQLPTKQLSARKRAALQKMGQKQKLTLPLINRQTQIQSGSKAELIKKLQHIAQEIKKSREQKKEIQKQIQEPKIKPQPQKKNKLQNDILLEAESNIIIKEMYTKNPPAAEIITETKNLVANPQPEKEKEDANLAMTKLERQKNKKMRALRSKFPQIKVSTFYSTKENDEQKKIRLQNLQKIISSSKAKPAKKVYFQKSLEEIPERWQYGESRQYSREEVQQYLSIKKQEELGQLSALQQERKRLLQMQEQAHQQQQVQRKESIQAIEQSLINKVV